MQKLKFKIDNVATQLHPLIEVLKTLPSYSPISQEAGDDLIKQITSIPRTSIQIYFDGKSVRPKFTLEFSDCEDFYHNSSSTKEYTPIQDVDAFIANHKRRYKNVVFHVNTPGEARAVLAQLLILGEITQAEYNSCFPEGEDDRYMHHRSIFNYEGCIRFNREFSIKKMSGCCVDDARKVELSDFLPDYKERPHTNLIRAWLNDPTMRIEVNTGDNWDEIEFPSWYPNKAYRKMVVPPLVVKTAEEIKAEKLIAEMDAGVLAEVKRQLGLV